MTLLKRYSDKIENRITGRHLKSFVFIGKDNIRDKDILDLGCSYGWFERWAIENSCNSIIGIEPSYNNFQGGHKEIPKAKYIQGSALDIPLADNSIDIIVMWEILEHLPAKSERKVISEVRRVLKKDGELYLSVPHSTFLADILDPAWWFIGHRHYSLMQIEDIARDTGFNIERVEYGGGYWELFSMLLLYLFKWILNREIPFKGWFEKKRCREFMGKGGWTTIFVYTRPSRDLRLL